MDVRQLFAPPRPGATLTIDLGEVSGPDVIEALPPVAPYVLRTLRSVVVALLVAFSIGGAAPGATHLIAPLWTRPASLAGFALGQTNLALSESGAKAVLGRDLATGGLRWRLATADPPQYTIPVVGGGGLIAVVVRNVDADGVDDVNDSSITVLVTEDGTLLTRLPGNQVSTVPTSSLLLVSTGRDSSLLPCPPEAPVCTELAAFDIAAQREVWRRVLPGLLVPAVAGAGPLTRFATERRDGTVDIRDPATGDASRSVRLPDRPVAGTPQLMQVGDTLVYATRGEDRATLDAIAVGPTGRAWTAMLPVARTVTANTARFYLAGCGHFVCLHADGADAVFDVDTGGLHGQVGYQVVGEIGPTLIAVPSAEQPGTPQSRRTVYLLDAADVQRTATFADTVVVWWRDSDGRVLLAHQGSAGTQFIIIDAHGEQHLLGTVAIRDLVCAASGTVLVCSDTVGLVRAWRLPVAPLSI